jgi:uncharacterized protein (DUF2141 family)
MIKSVFKILFAAAITALLAFNEQGKGETYTLTVKVEHLRNSKGVLQVTLYNKEGTIPDEKYRKYYKKGVTVIGKNDSAEVSFSDLPEGTYAVNILHDENENGKIDKKFILPKEGIGFSNYASIGLSNRPNFSKASFKLETDKEITVKVIYM